MPHFELLKIVSSNNLKEESRQSEYNHQSLNKLVHIGLQELERIPCHLRENHTLEPKPNHHRKTMQDHYRHRKVVEEEVVEKNRHQNKDRLYNQHHSRPK